MIFTEPLVMYGAELEAGTVQHGTSNERVAQSITSFVDQLFNALCIGGFSI